MFSIYGATYNSFREQPGFCFLQGYDTLSRETTGMYSPMFLDGRVWSGVGLSNAQFNNSVKSCGACIQVKKITINEFDSSLTTWSEEPTLQPERIVVVADQCKDPICESGWLDFDVYSDGFPDNPKELEWSFVPCPVLPHEDIGLLFCPSESCQRDFSENRTFGQVVEESSRYFWSLYAHNLKYPLTSVRIDTTNASVYLEDTNGWMYRFSEPFDFLQPFRTTLCSEQECIESTIHLKPGDLTTPGFRGGKVVGTGVQFT
jgi:hypothetical protein